MKKAKLHANVWLWWGRWWAVQLWPEPYFSLGFHIDLRRPLLDLHLGWLIVALGRFPIMTNERDLYKHSSRGFLRTDDPLL